MSNNENVTPIELTETNKSIYGEESFGLKDFFVGAVVGGLIGAAVALLYAPKPGAELRSDVAKNASQLKEKSVELSSVAKEKTVQLSSQLKDQSTQIVEKVKSKTSNVSSVEEEGISVDEDVEAAVDQIIKNNRLDEFKIPTFIQPYLIDTWENNASSIYGRFDFAFDKNKQLKLLEFNADTPTSLFECGVVQWLWMENYFGDTKDQFNSVHDKLIETWRILKPYLKGEILHFSCVKDSLEDLTNIEYLRDCAIQAGINTKLIYVDDIGWNNVNFVDLEEEPITDIFKLYPWEWMVNELFAYNIKNDEIKANWIEPAWKMILSNKAILAVLWELYPNHHLLLETYIDNPKEMNDYAKKPLLSREGANVEIFKDGQLIEKSFGEYGEEGFIYQELAELHQEETGYSIIGSWIIGQAFEDERGYGNLHP